jgi:predicted enzyme related to lactoylglutathione lyase
MPTIVHFDIAADDVKRAASFYEQLFGWKVSRPPGPMEYYLIGTTDREGRPGVGGGIGTRQGPGQAITNFIGVDSIDAYLRRVSALGGRVLQPKMPVPGFGFLAVCLDTENNPFGLWEDLRPEK